MWYGWNRGIKYFEKSKAHKCLQLGIITIWIGWNEIWVPHSLFLLEEYLFTPHLMHTLSLDLWRLAHCSPRDLNYYCCIHRTQFFAGLGGIAAFPFTFLKLFKLQKKLAQTFQNKFTFESSPGVENFSWKRWLVGKQEWLQVGAYVPIRVGWV